MKFNRYLFTVMALCVCFACCGCERDMSLTKAKISATVDGMDCEPYYYCNGRYPSGSVPQFHISDVTTYLQSRDRAVPITGTSHDITITFKKVKPDFTRENLELWVFQSGYYKSSPGCTELGAGHLVLDYEVTNFQYKNGKMSFHFEMKGEFPEDAVMLSAAILYKYEGGTLLVNMTAPGLCPPPAWPIEE